MKNADTRVERTKLFMDYLQNESVSAGHQRAHGE
jgi:hypothetical protein